MRPRPLLWLPLVFLLGLASPAQAGDFIKKAVGRDANGRPIYQYVYDAGKSRFAPPQKHSARVYRPSSIGRGYRSIGCVPRRTFIGVRRVPLIKPRMRSSRLPHRPSVHSTTTRRGGR